jgi:hypothetical protein
MTREDLKAVMEFLNTVTTLDSNMGTVDKLIEQTGRAQPLKRGEPLQEAISLQEFNDFFEQLAGIKNTKEYVTDFENSDRPKTLFGSLVAFVVFASAVALIVLGATTNGHVFSIVGLVSLAFAIYVGLYSAGFNLQCPKSEVETGAPNNLPGYFAMIFFAFGGASYAYGAFVQATASVTLLMVLCFVLGGLFLTCRLAAYLPVVGEWFRNPEDITEQEISRYVDKGFLPSEKKPSSPAPTAKTKSRGSVDTSQFDEEVGLSPKSAKSRASRSGLTPKSPRRRADELENGLAGRKEPEPAIRASIDIVGVHNLLFAQEQGKFREKAKSFGATSRASATTPMAKSRVSADTSEIDEKVGLPGTVSDWGAPQRRSLSAEEQVLSRMGSEPASPTYSNAWEKQHSLEGQSAGAA